MHQTAVPQALQVRIADIVAGFRTDAAEQIAQTRKRELEKAQAVSNKNFQEGLEMIDVETQRLKKEAFQKREAVQKAIIERVI